MATTGCDQQRDGTVDRPPYVPASPPTSVATPPADEEACDAQGRPDAAPQGPSRRIGVPAGSRAVLIVAAWLITGALAARIIGEPATKVNVGQILMLGLGVVVCFVAVAGAGPQRARLKRPTRIAVIGRQATAVALQQDLVTTRITGYESVGWITARPEHSSEFPMPRALGGIREIAALVERHQIDLLLIGSDVPRLDVFDELVRLTDTVGIRVCELSAFYEDAFGHIPVAEINSTWFQYVMHPKFTPNSHHSKRVFDIVLAVCLGIVALPLLALAAALIKLDGGRVLYAQRRIGEKGRPFTMYKLRTMRDSGPEDDAQTWCSVDDPRVTPLGVVLRRLHIDELPQLYNILRGEMSVVGPRPEQPDIVTRLEAGISFYSRRHLIKPGLAGWAQLRCGYVRSETGSAWKLCHDLYYLKHQSLRLDIAILVRTFLMLARPKRLPERDAATFAAEPLITSESYAPTPVRREAAVGDAGAPHSRPGARC